MFKEKWLHLGGMDLINLFNEGRKMMNVLKELNKKIKGKFTVKTVLGDETYCFMWNAPASVEDINAFEKRNGCRLPDDYKEFLLIANGAIIYKSEYEDDGYKLLGIEDIENVTNEMKNDGYYISDGCYCFVQCLFSDDVLLLDVKRENNYIIDGDVGYPSEKWEYINADLNTFFIRLCQCNGAMYWRW